MEENAIWFELRVIRTGDACGVYRFVKPFLPGRGEVAGDCVEEGGPHCIVGSCDSILKATTCEHPMRNSIQFPTDRAVRSCANSDQCSPMVAWVHSTKALEQPTALSMLL